MDCPLYVRIDFPWCFPWTVFYISGLSLDGCFLEFSFIFKDSLWLGYFLGLSFVFQHCFRLGCFPWTVFYFSELSLVGCFLGLFSIFQDFLSLGVSLDCLLYFRIFSGWVFPWTAFYIPDCLWLDCFQPLKRIGLPRREEKLWLKS